MTPTSMLHALLRLRGGAPTSPVEIAGELLRRVPEDRDIVAVTVAGSALRARLLEAVSSERLFLHAVAQPDAVAGVRAMGEPGLAPAVELGACDRDLLPAARVWPSPTLQAPRRLRRLDTLYADSHHVGLLALECARSTAAVLEGARRLLREQAPIVLLDLGAVVPTERVGLVETLVEVIGPTYQWLDGLALPLVEPRQRLEVLRHCAEQVLLAVPIDGALACSAGGRATAADADGALLGRLAWQGWRSLFACDPRPQQPVAFSDALACAGFHAAETDGDSLWWRWTGPSARSDFAIPAPSAGRWRLRLSALYWGEGDDPAALRLQCRGRPLTLLRTEGDMAEFGWIEVAPGCIPAALGFTLVTPPTRRASEEDARMIGICLTRAALVSEAV